MNECAALGQVVFLNSVYSLSPDSVRAEVWERVLMQVGVEYNDEDEDEKWHHHQLNPTTLCTFLASLDLFFNWSPFFFLKMISFLFETLFPLSLF